jgi:YfiH family protein
LVESVTCPRMLARETCARAGGAMSHAPITRGRKRDARTVHSIITRLHWRYGDRVTDVLSSPLLSQFGWIAHGFGTREAVLPQEEMATLTQIHSSLPLVADRNAGCVGEGDALITARPGVAVSVRTADCFPILFADSRRRVVAAVHAGWRGTAACVVGATLERMRDEFATEPRDVYAAIGPGIGVCCYQVGSDVAGLLGLEHAGRADLAAVNREQFLMAGVPKAQIETPGACTFCDARRFHSYRRDGDRAGRQISFIKIC